jgi:hypothetical protein
MCQAYSVIVESRRAVGRRERFVEIVCKILTTNHVADTDFEVEGTPQRTGAVSMEDQEAFQAEIVGIAAVGAAESEKVENGW